MDLVFLSVLIGVAMAVAIRVSWSRPLWVRLMAAMIAAEGVGLVISSVSRISPFYFVSRYRMMGIFAFLASFIAVGYAKPLFLPGHSGLYSVRLLLGLLLGGSVYAGYWLFLRASGLLEELPVRPPQILFAFLALGLLIVLGYSATAGILRTYWPPPATEQQ
jgi:hypothetical protein